MPVEKISGRARKRRKKRAKNQARREERTALFVTIRMAKGEIPELVKHQPNHWLRRYVDILETTDWLGYDYVVAMVRLEWGAWVARRRNDSFIGKFATEDEAKAVTLVTIRMEQADEPTRLEPTTRRPHLFINRKR